MGHHHHHHHHHRHHDRGGVAFLVFGGLAAVFVWKILTLYWLGLLLVGAGLVVAGSLGRAAPGQRLTAGLCALVLLLGGVWALMDRFQGLQAFQAVTSGP